jgi:hypothetical protein
MKCYVVSADGKTHFYICKSNINKNTYGITKIPEDVGELRYFVAICCYETYSLYQLPLLTRNS